MLGIGKSSEISGISELKPGTEGFLKIKPEGKSDFGESKRFFDQLFQNNLPEMDESENLQAGAVALESTKLELFENKHFLSEVDEVRIKETAEIMEKVFSEDVFARWGELTLEEKTAKLNEYYVKAGKNLGINTKGVIIESMYSECGTILGYNAGDGYIHLNKDVVEDSSMLEQVLDTATHEMRHQFQNDVVANPSRFSDIPANVLETWYYEFRNYIAPEYDLQGYYEQKIESDAREFSENVLEAYMDKIN